MLPLTEGHHTKEASFTSNLIWLSRDLLSSSSMYEMVEYSPSMYQSSIKY
jgi:hypothetical protein